MKPILKWAGGKSRLVNEIKSIINLDDLKEHCLYEPFVGAGALFMDIKNKNVVINDYNKELINVYLVIKNSPDDLIVELKKHKKNHSKEYYYAIRNLDRNDDFTSMSAIKKAARTIYLNRVCFNGLYRVNSSGFFNVPCGKYKNPNIVQEKKIFELSKYLRSNNIDIRNMDFEDSVKDAKEGDVIYFDPPYDYENSNGFTSYTSKGFTRKDLVRLEKVCNDLIKKGCFVIISNNKTEFVDDIFKDKKFKKKLVITRRCINCKGNKRKPIEEVIIYG